MGIKTYNPYTPSRRNMTGSDFSEITKTTPEKSLCVSLKKNSGTGISTLLLSASEWKDNAPQTSCYSIEFKRYDAASVKAAPKDSDHV